MLEGYFINEGYIGLVDGEWMLFASESDYIDFMKGDQNEDR